FEITSVNLVDDLKVADVREKNCGLRNILKSETFGLQQATDALHHAARLDVDATGNHLSSFRIERDLPRVINCGSNAHSLGIRSNGRGRLGRGDDFLHASILNAGASRAIIVMEFPASRLFRENFSHSPSGSACSPQDR